MTKTKSTKRALLTSALALLMCVSMLIGSTFAWFTDSVTSGNNKIVAGTLDVDLLMADADGEYASIGGEDAAIFGEGSLAQNNAQETLWEPGKTQIVYLAVANNGNLDLKYNIALNVVDGGLIGSLEYAIVDGAQYGALDTYTDWATLKADAQTGDVVAGTTVAAPNGAIVAGEDAVDYFALAVHMKEEAGNEYQGKDITIDVTVLATQLASESDSFGSDYDANAEFDTVVYNVADLQTALADGGDVMLGTDITVSGTVITTNGVTEAYGNKVGVAQYGGTLDGNGNTLTETGTSAYVIVTHGGTIKNLNIVGGGRGIVIYAPTEDVIIDNVVIDGPGYAINTAEHNGQDLIVTNSTIKGWTSLAGLDSISFTNCLFGENSTKCWQNYGYSQHYDRLIKPYGQATFTDCTFEEGFYIDLSALASGNTITLTNCNSDEVVLTADNYADHITIKLPSWATSLSDCVNFN